jgi:hypothetical protein
MVSSSATLREQTNAKLSTSLHLPATGSRYLVLTSLHSHHTSRTHTAPPSGSMRSRHGNTAQPPRLPTATLSTNFLAEPPQTAHRFVISRPLAYPHILAITTAATSHHHHRATMPHSLKRKRTEDVDPLVEESRRRVNAFKAEDEAKERIARYRMRDPASIRFCHISMIHKPRILTRYRA